MFTTVTTPGDGPQESHYYSGMEGTPVLESHLECEFGKDKRIVLGELNYYLLTIIISC